MDLIRKYDCSFKDMGDHYLLNGAKCGFLMPFADIAVVWQKTKKEEAVVVERGMEGFTTPNS
jgi:glutaryl-CoA dehydrogenase